MLWAVEAVAQLALASPLEPAPMPQGERLNLAIASAAYALFDQRLHLNCRFCAPLKCFCYFVLICWWWNSASSVL